MASLLWGLFFVISMCMTNVIAISLQADKEALNVRHIPNQANHPNRRNLPGQDVMNSGWVGKKLRSSGKSNIRKDGVTNLPD